VGSPLRLCILAAAALLAVGATAASADANPEGDARATAVAFFDAVIRGDAERVCSLYSPDAIARLGGAERCRSSMGESEDGNEADYGALESLLRAHTAARLSATKRRGSYVTKKFGPRKLARDMEQLDPELTVKLGRSATAAKGQLVTTVVLDTRSTGRRLVLYAESDDGSIFRLSAATTGQPDFEEVGTGIPETSPKPAEPPRRTFSATIDTVTFDTAGTAFARGTFVVAEDDETYTYGILLELVPLNGAYYVDDLYYSTLRSGEES
jgi:hypothetical protein